MSLRWGSHLYGPRHRDAVALKTQNRLSARQYHLESFPVWGAACSIAVGRHRQAIWACERLCLLQSSNSKKESQKGVMFHAGETNHIAAAPQKITYGGRGAPTGFLATEYTSNSESKPMHRKRRAQHRNKASPPGPNVLCWPGISKCVASLLLRGAQHPAQLVGIGSFDLPGQAPIIIRRGASLPCTRGRPKKGKRQLQSMLLPSASG